MLKFVDLEKQYLRYRAEIDRQMAEVITSTAFILGPKVEELERKLAAFTGVSDAVGVSSGTSGLDVALMDLGIGPGDEVITTPFTFIATAEVIAAVGARPVFADIEPQTYNIDPERIEPLIGPATKAILPVSLYGQCADFRSINALAARHGLPVIEDGAQSFGALQDGRRSCGLSTIGVTSFFPSKPLGCYGDGGMVFTNDAELAARMRQIRMHGQDRRYHHIRPGLNARLDALQAAVLLAKIPHFEEEIALRNQVAAAYTERLDNLPGITLPVIATGNTHVWAQYSLQTEGRDELAAFLQSRGIPTAVHYPVPLHRQQVFAPLDLPEGSFPIAERAAQRILSLPMHPFLSATEIDLVAGAVREWAGTRSSVLE